MINYWNIPAFWLVFPNIPIIIPLFHYSNRLVFSNILECLLECLWTSQSNGITDSPGGNADLAGQPPDGADRKKALQWLKDALLKISEAHDKSYQLPVKWLIGNWRLWPDEDEGDSKKDPGFVDLKNLAIRKLDGIGKKYEDLYKERKLGMELGFIGENLTFEIRPRQDHYLVPPGYFGLKELHDRALGNKPTDTELHEHERKKQSSFIIFLLTAVHGVDHIFQEVAKEICESVAGTSRAPPPKGFMRMWAKLDTDHASAKSPRAAENIDTNRVAWIFEEPSQLRDAFEKAQKIFGAPLRVKNGYDPAFPAMAETKGYRNILANYKFSPEITWGALAGREGPNEKATKTEAAWDKFRTLGSRGSRLWNMNRSVGWVNIRDQWDVYPWSSTLHNINIY